jgi:excisionase family DNA binding protein
VTADAPGPALLVDAGEAARLLCVSPRTLWGLTAPRGDLPAVRIGARAVRYNREDLAEWIARHRSGAANGHAHPNGKNQK